MALRNPNEASTYGLGVLRGLREIRQSPDKMKELGITKDMDVFQRLEAIDQAVEKAKANGEEEGGFPSRSISRTFANGAEQGRP